MHVTSCWPRTCLRDRRRHAIPIEPAAPQGAPPTAISCIGAFRTPTVSACGYLSTVGVRKPDQNPTHAVQQNSILYSPADLFGPHQDAQRCAPNASGAGAIALPDLAKHSRAV